MLTLNLFILRDNGTLLTSQSNAATLNPLTLPLAYGDGIILNVWVYTALSSTINPVQNFPYQIVNNAGLTPVLYITNGTIAGGGNNSFAACVEWVPDPTNSYVTGTLSLATPGLLALLGNSTNAKAYLSFGFLQNGLPNTCLFVPVNIGVGVQNVVPAVPPGLTPLTVQEAVLMFFPFQPIPGQPLYLATKSGKVIEVTAVDDGGGGHIENNPSNWSV